MKLSNILAGMNAFIDGVQKGAIIAASFAVVAIAAKYCAEESE